MRLGPEALQTLQEGARYSSLIASVVHAYIADDKDELHFLLDAVDPIEARHTANKLRVVYEFHAPDRGGSTSDSSDVGSGPSDDSSSLSTAGVLDGDDWPTAPNVYPMVVHAGDNWSRKVPCR